MLSLCALAAGAACSGGSGAALSPVPAESTAASSSVGATTTAELRTLPYPLVDEDEDENIEVRIKFIAYGDVDPNDDIDLEVIPDLQIAVITEGELQEWWDAVVTSDLGYTRYPPPGAQIRSTGKDIETSPIDFIITGADGTVETYLKPSESFLVCVVSLTDASIAGCSLKETTGRWREMVFYVYYSHGRAYIDREQDGNERYGRFLHGDRNLYSPSAEPATVTFVSTAFPNRLNNSHFEDKFLAPGAQVAVISDSDIGAWWNAVSDNGTYSLNASKFEFGWEIPYDRVVRERVRKNTPIRTVVIDWPGIIEVNLSPGDYLFCDLKGLDEDSYAVISDCTYTDIAAARDYIFEVNYGVFELSDKGRELMEDAKNWDFTP